MGHHASKDVYRDLGRAIDGLTARVPWSETLRRILRELYTEAEATLVSRMPTGLASLGRIRDVTGAPEAELRPLLEGLAAKGLVMDLEVGGEPRFTVSPMVIGIFEFTMMRTDGAVDFPRMARLFHEYLSTPDGFFAANAAQGERVSVMRTLPHGEAIVAEPHVEVLDHERAAAIVEAASATAVGICSCRHEKRHLGHACEAPLESCVSIGDATDYMVRRGLARPCPKGRVHDLLAEARDRGMVMNADNVRQGVSFLCLCCSCCCNVLTGIRRHGLPNVVVTSGYLATVRASACTGCAKCARACPIGAIEMVDAGPEGSRKRPAVDTSFCIGCGVCGLACGAAAMRLVARPRRALLPEHTVERVILQALERGTLQNFLVDNPNTTSSRFLRAVAGAFLSLPPVKRAIMSAAFRSRFLSRLA